MYCKISGNNGVYYKWHHLVYYNWHPMSLYPFLLPPPRVTFVAKKKDLFSHLFFDTEGKRLPYLLPHVSVFISPIVGFVLECSFQ